jgi:hypothetical protein
MVVFHQKADGITGLLAAKTVIKLFVLANRKRR